MSFSEGQLRFAECGPIEVASSEKPGAEALGQLLIGGEHCFRPGRRGVPLDDLAPLHQVEELRKSQDLGSATSGLA